MAEISPLRRRMIDDMMIRNLSPATQQSYLYVVAKFSRYFGRSPDRLGLEEVQAYQLHLIAQQRSWSHCPASAPMRQKRQVEEGRIYGSSSPVEGKRSFRTVAIGA